MQVAHTLSGLLFIVFVAVASYFAGMIHQREADMDNWYCPQVTVVEVTPT
jgi:hypothetical protein